MEQGKEGQAVGREEREREQTTEEYIAATTDDTRLHLQKLWQSLPYQASAALPQQMPRSQDPGNEVDTAAPLLTYLWCTD